MYPDALTEIADLLCDCLQDKEPSVQIAAVSTILEISRINPKIFLYALPKIFELFNSKSNWLVIKLIKAVSSLSFLP
jgi:hypothetical protein